MKLFLPILSAVALTLATMSAVSQERPIRNHGGGNQMADTLRAGDPAPDFTLKTKDGKREVTLSGFTGKRPVVLIFGSYT